MRDRFNPLAPLLHQSHSSHYQSSPMQGQFQNHQQPSKPPFGYTAGGYSAGEKRTNNAANHDENVDCNLLQSSLKRVRLSRSPGEFRLQRDLKTLDAMQWGSSHVAPNALNFSSTTWIHRSTGTRLTMVDSLRICLFLPLTAMNQQQSQTSGQFTSDINPQQQYQHQIHSYHRDYKWRIMIQIPRMYPHSPPVVTRIDGLALDGIVINEQPPDAHHHFQPPRDNQSSDGSSNRGVESLFFTETQLARSQSSRTMTSTETQGTLSALSMLEDSGKTIEWNQWSPITGLGELLDFLLGAASSNLSTTSITGKNVATTTNNNSTMMGTNDFQTMAAVTTSRMSSEYSSSSLSSVSSASSLSSWGNRNPSSRGNNTVAATETSMMTDENATTSSDVSGASFLSPNRFDVGYGKSGFGFAGTTPRTTNTTSAWQLHQQQYRGKQQGDEDVGMDMS